MSDKPKRRFWQIHLSTAVILMLFAAGMCRMNTVGKEYLVPDLPTHYYFLKFGTPVTAYVYPTPAWIQGVPSHYLSRLLGERYGWCAEGVLIDAACSALILFAVGALLEFLIRHRERRAS